MSSSSWHRLLLEPRGVTDTIALFSSGDGLLTRPALPTEGLEGETRGWSCLRKTPRPLTRACHRTRQGLVIGPDQGVPSDPTRACHRTRQGLAIGREQGLPSDAGHKWRCSPIVPERTWPRSSEVPERTRPRSHICPRGLLAALPCCLRAHLAAIP